MKISSSLRAKTILLVLSVVLFVFTFIGFFVGIRSERLAKIKAHEYAWLMADKNAQTIRSLIEPHLGFVQGITDSYSANSEVNGNSTAFIEQFLKVQSKAKPYYKSVWTVWNREFIENKEGAGQLVYEWDNTQNKIVIFDGVDKAGYGLTHAIAMNNAAVQDPFFEGDKIYTNVCLPIKKAGRIVGYAGVTIDLHLFDSYIENEFIYEGDFITLMSNSGMFLAHKNKNLVGKTFARNFPDDESNFDVHSKIKNAKKFNITTYFQDYIYYSSFVPVEISQFENDWMVEITIPMHTFLSDSKKSLRSSIFVALIGVILISFGFNSPQLAAYQGYVSVT